MSTAVAPAQAAPLTSPRMTRDLSPKNCPTLAPATSNNQASPTPPRLSAPSRDGSSAKSSPAGKKPTSPSSQAGSNAARVIVKKEPPSSPAMQINTRPRPRRLDLSTSLPNSGGLSARAPGGPMTAREGVNMQDVGIACLSPGFQTHNPAMREQLQRSLSVRDQQRSIIESRLQKSAKDDGPDGVKPSEAFGVPRGSVSKRRPPPGLSIVPPSAAQFANERVIQSAPLHQTFTGRHEAQPLTRHVVNQSPTLGSTSHIHHVPATQTNNRLPPLSDVFGSDALGARDRDGSRGSYYPNATGNNLPQSNNLPPIPSPRISRDAAQPPKRPREYRSAEEAVQELSGGREELLPRIVHYGGHQPPTPPSPRVASRPPKSGVPHLDAAPMTTVHPPPPALYPSEGTARRRSRNEYEHEHGSPPLGHGPEPQYRPNPALASGASASHGPFGAGRDSPETQRKKKEEFLSLCARAWDLFHS
ncbi:hypothetical protein BO70DRAFT_33591 [Aspergillus heteromorphus CBS 117.55]|uniref:Uncharacterized protein n=1 Tax=Aspergillus heteromorphus CBS 117.55 TaxID=1448321 RepID=A0A317WCS1_9EURO|nr:uncharacterized protein BO70DRAFT_33591 [Aspergillus heteromorphus CBS 117.55]PWY83002.1 hypothetical protein BO70DRAFT_33591 [Aspergillus heteromorphus CBS 117.55]